MSSAESYLNVQQHWRVNNAVYCHANHTHFTNVSAGFQLQVMWKVKGTIWGGGGITPQRWVTNYVNWKLNANQIFTENQTEQISYHKTGMQPVTQRWPIE